MMHRRHYDVTIFFFVHTCISYFPSGGGANLGITAE